MVGATAVGRQGLRARAAGDLRSGDGQCAASRVRDRARDGTARRIATSVDVTWINAGTEIGRTITSATPPMFDAYATVVLPEPDPDRDEHHRTVLTTLAEQSPAAPWWLGYLETGGEVFPADRTWLVSRLWDDDWRCLGGPRELVGRFVHGHRLARGATGGAGRGCHPARSPDDLTSRSAT